MRRDRSLAWVPSVLVLMPFFLSACASTVEIPVWFDAIHRVPVETVVVDGHRIAYLDEGEGPPAMLVHGFGGSLWQWEYQQQALAGHRVITVDLLGAGLSDKPDIVYTPTVLVEFFRAFMDALDLPRASLVGNSMGAGVVIGMALSYPERVDRIVLISGMPQGVREKVTSPLMKRALDSWAPVWLVNLGNRIVGRGVTTSVLREMVHNPELLTAAVIERSYRNRRRPGLMAPLLSLSKNLPLWEAGFAKRIGEIRQPSLVIWGAEDKIFPAHVGRELRATIPHALFELIPEAGHIPMWERPELVNPVLVEFLAP